MKDIVFFDLETTGLSIHDRIVQISMVKTDRNLNVLDNYNKTLNPTIPIQEEASEVHGITDAVVKDMPIFSDILQEVVAFIGDSDLGGFNIGKFDVPLLVEEMYRYGYNFDILGRKIIDSYSYEAKLYPRDLGSLYKKYVGIELEGAHDAQNDVVASIQVLKSQMEKSEMNLNQVTDLLEEGNGIYLDASKRIQLIEGEPCLTFGKHKGMPLKSVPKEYLNWLILKDFGSSTKTIVKNFL